MGTSSTLSGVFSAGETVTCTVTAHDGTDAGNSVSDSVSISASNAAPTVTGVTIEPDPAYTNNVLSVSYTADDADGDSLTISYSWTIGGTEVGTGDTLSGDTAFDRNETVTVTVTADDGVDTGDGSDSVTVSNTPPTPPEASVTPEAFDVGLDDIVCARDLDSSDDDSDTVNYTIEWMADGLDYPAAFGSATGPTTTTETDDTVPAADTSLADLWTCFITPFDGDDDGLAAEASAEPASASGSLDSSRSDLAGGPSSSTNGQNNLLTQAITFASDVTVTGFAIDFASTTSCNVCDFAIYEDSGGPAALVGSVSGSCGATGTNEVTLSVGFDVPAGNYQLAHRLGVCSTTFPVVSDDGSSSRTMYYQVSTAGGSFPDPASPLGSFPSALYAVWPIGSTGGGGPTIPFIGSAAITPDPAYEGDTLTCSYSGFGSPNSGSDVSTYSWTIGGSEVGTSSTLSSGFHSGDEVICAVTPDDGVEVGDVVHATLNIEPPFSYPDVTSLVAGDLIITEIMPNPDAVTDANGEWFEVYNASGMDVDLQDLVLSDNGASHTVDASLVVLAGEYVVFARNSDIGTNGGVSADHEWTSLQLTNANDVVTLSYGGTTFDEVDYSGWGPSAGASLSLAFSSDVFDTTDNDDPTYWCDGEVVYGDGDLGSPGSANGEWCGTATTYGPTGTTLNYGLAGPNYILAQLVTVGADGVVAGFGASSHYGGFNNVELALYEDNGGAPGALVAYSESTLAGEFDFSLALESSAAQVAAGDYWIAFSGDNSGTSAHYLYYDTSVSVTVHYRVLAYGTAWPDPFSTEGTFPVSETIVSVEVVSF